MSKTPQCLVDAIKNPSETPELIEEVAFGLFSDGTVRMRSTIEDPEESLDMVSMTVAFMRDNMTQAEVAQASNELH